MQPYCSGAYVFSPCCLCVLCARLSPFRHEAENLHSVSCRLASPRLPQGESTCSLCLCPATIRTARPSAPSISRLPSISGEAGAPMVAPFFFGWWWRICLALQAGPHITVIIMIVIIMTTTAVECCHAAQMVARPRLAVDGTGAVSTGARTVPSAVECE